MLTWLGRAARQTAGFWPPLRRAYRWVERMAAALANDDRREAGEVRRRVAGVVSALGRSLPRAGKYRHALAHFVKVTRSYGAHLFACYAVAGLPRTNNDREQTFGRYRYHERRATGRKVAGPSTVVRGRVRLVAALATRLRRSRAAELAPRRRRGWQQVRRELAERQRPRRWGVDFAADPKPTCADWKSSFSRLLCRRGFLAVGGNSFANRATTRRVAGLRSGGGSPAPRVPGGDHAFTPEPVPKKGTGPGVRGRTSTDEEP